MIDLFILTRRHFGIVTSPSPDLLPIVPYVLLSDNVLDVSRVRMKSLTRWPIRPCEVRAPWRLPTKEMRVHQTKEGGGLGEGEALPY